MINVHKTYTHKQQLHILFLATNAVELLKCNVQVMRWSLWIHLIYNYVSTLGPALQPSSVLHMYQANPSYPCYNLYILYIYMHALSYIQQWTFVRHWWWENSSRFLIDVSMILLYFFFFLVQTIHEVFNNILT